MTIGVLIALHTAQIGTVLNVEPPFPGGHVVSFGSDANPIVKAHCAIGNVAVE